jgi:hypothetical protein
MENEPGSASVLDMLERMKNYLGTAGRVGRTLEERLKALLASPVSAAEPRTEGHD